MAKRSQMDAAVAQLIVGRKFSVARKGKDLSLLKLVAGRPVTIFLKDCGDGYWIEPPKREFVCTYSHFEFQDREQRYTRQKGTLLSVVKHLKTTKVWDFILNKNFFVPNSCNSKMDKRSVRDQYREVVGRIK